MRKLSRVVVAVPVNALTNLLTCPAGHKYEIVSVSAGGDLVNQYEWRVHVLTAPLQFNVDSIVVPPTQRAVNHSYQGIILAAGDTLQITGVTAGALAVNISVMYVDVSPV